MAKKIGRKKIFTRGVVVQIIASALLMVKQFIFILILKFVSNNTHTILGKITVNGMWLMYPTVILMGISQSIALNTSINLIGEVVGIRAD